MGSALLPSPAWLSQEAAEQTEALLAHAQYASTRSDFQAWLDGLDAALLALVLAGGRDAAVSFLIHENGCVYGPISDRLVSLTVGLASRWGWDVRRRLTEDEAEHVTRDTGNAPVNQTLLEWLCGHHPHSRHGLDPGLRWPTALPEFFSFSETHELPRNQAWLIALVVASGANPWLVDDTLVETARPNGLADGALFETAQEDHCEDEGASPCHARCHRAFQYCVHRGHWDIALQLMSLPGAPSLRAAWDEPLEFSRKTTLDSVLECGFSNLFSGTPSEDWKTYHEQGFINLLLAFPDCRLRPTELSSLSARAVEALHQAGWLHADDEAAIMASYQDRAGLPDKRGGYCPLEHARLSVLFSDGNLEQEAALGQAARFLAKHAMERPGSLGWQPKPEEAGLGLFWVTRPLPVTGPWAAPWTVWTAQALQKLATIAADDDGYDTEGCEALPWRFWFHVRQGPRDASWDRQDGKGPLEKKHPALRGALQHQLLATSDDGWAAAGIVCLLALGKAQSRFWPLPEDPWEDLADESLLFDVHDWVSFAELHAEAAVSVTRWVIDHAPAQDAPGVKRSLQAVWAQCWRRHPDWLANRPALAAQVVSALAGGMVTWHKPFSDDSEWRLDVQHDPWSRLAGLLMDSTRWKPPSLPPACAHHRAVCMELLLAFFDCEDDFPLLMDWVASGALTNLDTARLLAWCDRESASAANHPWVSAGHAADVAAFQQALLDVQLQAASGSVIGRRRL